ARREARVLRGREGLDEPARAALATAVSEVARNVVVHGGGGEVVLGLEEEDGGRRAIVVVASDLGPGIADPAQAMQDGWSTGRGLGLGLPSAKSLVDHFELTS